MLVKWHTSEAEACPGQVVTFTLVNRTGGLISFGLDYRVEHRQGATWIRCHDESAVLAVALSLRSGDERDFGVEIPLRSLPGLYRVIKPVFVREGSPGTKRRVESHPTVDRCWCLLL
jgi:hypothetical protein